MFEMMHIQHSNPQLQDFGAGKRSKEHNRHYMCLTLPSHECCCLIPLFSLPQPFPTNINNISLKTITHATTKTCMKPWKVQVAFSCLSRHGYNSKREWDMNCRNHRLNQLTDDTNVIISISSVWPLKYFLLIGTLPYNYKLLHWQFKFKQWVMGCSTKILHMTKKKNL